MRIRQSHHFRHTIAVISLIAGFLSACVWLINRPAVLSHALSLVNARGEWRIGVERLRWHPLQSTVDIDDISLTHKATGKTAHISEMEIEYRLLGLLRGRLVIDELLIKDVKMTLPPSKIKKEGKKPGRIDTARFLMIKHVELAEGRIEGFDLSFGKNSHLQSDEMRISLIPSIFGASRLAIRTDGIKLDKGEDEILSSGFISLKTSTRIEEWTNDFPYINDFSGELKVQDTRIEGAPIDQIFASIKFADRKLSLDNLDINVEGRKLLGSAAVDLQEQNFALAIDIPSPLDLPHIGKDIKTIDTGGKLSGKIRVKGSGLVPSRTSGSAQLDLSHSFSANPESPVRIATDIHWSDGVITIEKAGVVAGEDSLLASGTINIRGKNMDIEAQGKDFPIEHLFDKFKNPHLSKIFGRSDFTGSITGWGKDFKAHVEGITYEGGWKPIKAEKILTVLDANYNELKLVGTVLEKDKENDIKVGNADLTIKFGAKMADGRRHKNIDLEANISHLNLDYPLEELGVSGIGNGKITLKGPQTSFEGIARMEIDKGRFHGLSFDKASSDLSITRKKLEFSNIVLAMPSTSSSRFDGVLVGDLTPGRMRLHGEPIKGMLIDATYLYQPKRWNIKEFSWNDPENDSDNLIANGSMTSDGPIDLKIKGEFDAMLLSAVTAYVRENKGPVSVDLNIRGRSSDPRIFGTIDFDGISLTLRNPRIEATKLKGSLKFEGDRISFDNMIAEIEDGSAKLSGYLIHRDMKPVASDLKLDAQVMAYRSGEGSFTMELDGNLALEGKFPNPLLSGDVTIVDGRYSKDFTIIDMLTKKKAKKKLISTHGIEEFNPNLKLHVRSSGDMEIKNNVGEIFLNINVDVEGTREKPIITGSINTSEGYVDYLGLVFDITKGFIEFRGERDIPYLEVHAQKEVRVYNVNLILFGPVDNLNMELSATSPYGPLDKHDVVSLLLFGSTDQERDEQRRGGRQVGASMAASGIGGVLGTPISRFAHIDTFKLESPDVDSDAISKVKLGKEISDRLTVTFATDVGIDNAVQTFAAEYLITDNLLIEGQRSTDAKYQFSGILRFRLR